MPPIMASNGANSPPNPPRLCHIVLSSDFKGYGFNLHTVKEKTGQFIGQVDEGSPAERAHLKKGDRIIEVNGSNISNENHKQVVVRIKDVENETRLLVVDSSADGWYRSNNIVISSKMAEVVEYSSVSRRSSKASLDHKSNEDRRSVASAGSGSSAVNSEVSNSQEDIGGNEAVSGGGGSNLHEDESVNPMAEYDNVTFQQESHAVHEEKQESDGPVVESDEERRVSSASSSADEGKAVSENEKASSDDEKADSDDEQVDSVQERNVSDDDKESSDDENDGGIVSKDSEPLASKDSDDDEATSDTSEKVSSELIENDKNSAHSKIIEADAKSTSGSEKSESIDLEPEKVHREISSERTTEEVVSSDSSVRRTESTSSASSGGSAANSRSTDKATEDKTPSSVSPSPPSSVGSPSPTPHSAPIIPGLNINMSAAEMRVYLASKKKKDIRNIDMDMRKKYDMIQKL